MKTKDISISKDRVVVDFNNQTIQFVVWDLKESSREDLKMQLIAAFAFSSNFKEIEKHMKINGYDCELEDIY